MLTCECDECESGGPEAVEECEPVLASTRGEHYPNQVAETGNNSSVIQPERFYKKTTEISLILGNIVQLCLVKGIVSRDFEWLQMILVKRLCVPDVPLKVYSFLYLHLHIVF